MLAHSQRSPKLTPLRPLGLLLSACCAAFVVCAIPPTVYAQQSWLVGKERVHQNLNPVSVTWSQSPLGEQLNSLSQQRRIAIWLDPDVDPTVKQTMRFKNRTTDQVVWETAHANGLGATWIGDILYVGPRHKTDRLPYVMEAAAKKLTKAKSSFPNRDAWRNSQSTTWADASTTEEVMSMFRQQGLDFEDPDKLIPLDVLAGADWPKQKGVPRVCLFLAGYGLTLEIGNAGKPKVIRMPDLESARTIAFVPDGIAIPAHFDGLWKKSRRGKVILEGPVDKIADFIAWKIQLQKPNVSDSQITTLSINVTEKRDSILKALAQQADLKFVIEQNCVETLNEVVTVSLKNATLELIVAECLKGSDLKTQITEKELKVTK